ncbi:MAG TPA: zf-HC2 domain-containing protein [Blastocatellia bacterium]|nr:zf-HC2 domain-containing protein [Blastocatellia bacterium]
MARKSPHPVRSLFDHLNGRLDAKTARAVENHVSGCTECASFVNFVRALRSNAETAGQSSPTGPLGSGLSPARHAGVGELASFFYNKTGGPAHASTAAHVALCEECRGFIALYADSEGVAARHPAQSEPDAKVPELAWKMIDDWEQSAFATLRPDSEAIAEETVSRLLRLMRERSSEIHSLVPPIAALQTTETSQRSDHIPVVIVNQSGNLRGVELFKCTSEPGGYDVLKHAEGSTRFDSKRLYVLRDLESSPPSVTTERIDRDTVRVENCRLVGQVARDTGYFIVEE